MNSVTIIEKINKKDRYTFVEFQGRGGTNMGTSVTENLIEL